MATPFADVLEGVAIEEPRYFHQNIFAPPKAYWHLDVPGGVSLGVNADRAHRGGITGRGVKVVMADTGWFSHPYFPARGYRSSPVVLGPAAANAAADEVGHGTAESANAFAVAPDIDFTMVKMSFVNSIGGFNTAVGLSPQIISCSWGIEQSVRSARARPTKPWPRPSRSRSPRGSSSCSLPGTVTGDSRASIRTSSRPAERSCARTGRSKRRTMPAGSPATSIPVETFRT